MTDEGRVMLEWSLPERLCLRALVECVVPQPGFDLAGRVERMPAEGKGDGWRFDALPADLAAWRRGVTSLDAASRRAHGTAFVGLPDALQVELLRAVRAGEVGKGFLGTLGAGEGFESFDATQMQQWFEDVRGEVTKLYVADARTMERMGFTGFADENGFTQIQLGEREVVEV